MGARKPAKVVRSTKVPRRLEDLASRGVLESMMSRPSMDDLQRSDRILQNYRDFDPEDEFELVIKEVNDLFKKPILDSPLTTLEEMEWVYADLKLLRKTVWRYLGKNTLVGPLVPLLRHMSEELEYGMSFRRSDILILWMLQLLFDRTLLMLGYGGTQNLPSLRLGRHVQRMEMRFDQLTDFVSDVASGIRKLFVPVVKKAPNLRVIYIMDDRISATELLEIGKNCKNLEVLKLGVSINSIVKDQTKYGKMPYTDDELSQTFFSGMNMREVLKAYTQVKEVPVSMPKLKYMHIDSIEPWKAWDFYKIFLHYYKNIEEFLSYEIGKELPFYEEVVKHNAILAKGKMKLKILELHSRDLLLPDIEAGLLALPHLRDLRVYCDFDAKRIGREHYHLSVKVGKILKDIMVKLPNVTRLYLYAEYFSTDEAFRATFFPAIETVGSRIKYLTFKNKRQSPVRLETQYQIINMCPNIESFRATFVYVTQKITSRIKTKLKPLNKLNFVYIQDLTQDTLFWPETEIPDYPKGSAVGLIKDVGAVAPNVEILVVSVDNVMSETLLRVVKFPLLKVLYVIDVYDYHTTDFRGHNVAYFRRLINKFPELGRVGVKTRDKRVVTILQQIYQASSLLVDNAPYDRRDPIWHAGLDG